MTLTTKQQQWDWLKAETRAQRAIRRIKTPGPVDGPVRRRKVGQCCPHTFKHHTASGGCRRGCECGVGPK